MIKDLLEEGVYHQGMVFFEVLFYRVFGMYMLIFGMVVACS